MLELTRRIWFLLDRRERRNGILLVLMMLGMGIVEVVGVISVAPFLAVVAEPNILTTNRYFVAVSEVTGLSDSNDLLILLGSCVFLIVLARFGVTAFTHWAMARYSSMRGYTLSNRLLRRYMRRPYAYFLNRHSSDLTRHVLAEVDQVISKLLVPLLELVAYGVVASFLILMIFIVNPVVAVVSVLVLGGAYTVIYTSLRGYATRLGAERINANKARFKLAQESLSAIKEVKALGLEEGYLARFNGPAKQHAKVQAKLKIVSELPQFGMRALVFGGMLVLVIWLLLDNDGELGKVLPLLGLYAYTGTRLIPALQRVYKAAMSIRFGTTALDMLHQDLAEGVHTSNMMSSTDNEPHGERLRLEKALVLDRVGFTYPDSEKQALQAVDMILPAKSTVGVVGSTGAGKTTVVDIMLGLLVPQTGRLVIDGQELTVDRVRAWQRNIGYVPQSIFLSDDSVTGNIAFGVPGKKIDQEAVERAARIAELHDFVVSEMPGGYETMVGERGVRLSGGQRQRIGIARALYHDPDVLIFDEATSALDSITEQAVMGAVHNLAHRKTIIMIAHRLTTVRECDTIFLLDQGRVSDYGTFDELVERNSRFRTMAQVPVQKSGC